jgi:hypothetical protein
MGVSRSRPSRAAPKKAHEHQCSHDRHGQDSQTKKRNVNPHGDAQHLAKMDAPFRTLREGLVPRSREKNDEFVQSWLQQTQARDSHLSRPSRDEGLPGTAKRARPRADMNRHGKRPRSLSNDAPPLPEVTGQVEHRFEKRARHKTRSDKYDYKARVGHKHVPD